MTYRVDTLETLFSSTEGDDDAAHVATRMEAALNAAEQGGWKLVQHIPQFKVFDDDGMPHHIEDQLFVFRKPETKKARLLN